MQLLGFWFKGLLTASALIPTIASAQLPIAGFDAAKEYPTAHLTPDANTEYKVLFDFVMNDDNLDDPYPTLPLVAKYVNTLANLGVTEESRKIAIVMQRGSGLIGLKNNEFKARNNGKDKPNIDLIKHRSSQTAACGWDYLSSLGQGVISKGIKQDDLLSEIHVDYWTLTTFIELGCQGYVKIGGLEGQLSMQKITVL